MAKVLDVQEFISTQTQLHKERRVSQYIYFLDKTPAFPLYYAINKIKSTTEYNTHEIDEYIGKDSPTRYDKIKNLPIYGMPEITNESEFDELIGTNSEGYSGESIIVPGILEPTEGDCFIVTYFNNSVLFVVETVSEVTLKARPHYKIIYHIENAEKIPQLERQVVSSNTAIFDNIGTENRVILSDDLYTDTQNMKFIYETLHDYYMNKFMKKQTTTFEISININESTLSRCTDKFLVMFLKQTRTMIMDKMLKSIFMVDNNLLYDGREFDQYEQSIFYAVENKNLNSFVPTNYVHLYALNNPFSLFKLQTQDILFVSQLYIQQGGSNDIYLQTDTYHYDFNRLYTKIKTNDISVTSNIDMYYNILVKYFNNTSLKLKDFDNLQSVSVTNLDKYYMLPMIMYILSLDVVIKTRDVMETYKLTPQS